jgi:serine/threonine-protein kinase
MFRDEGRIAAQFDHPGIVRVYGVDEFEGDEFLVMEFVEGRDLAQVLQAVRAHKTTVSASIVFEILRQALTALSYVHSFKGQKGKLQGIVHRDISPQNILISTEPKVKITDFGIARGQHRSDRTLTGTIKGKMHYMAPEQAAGLRVDARADLYALGAVAFEMLTGQPAFAPAPTEVLHRRAIDGEVDFGTKFKAQPDDVKAWLRKALARNPDERFQSADAMLGAMELLVRASRNGYRPQALAALLELPESKRSFQREQRERPLFVGDDAIALGRAKGAIVTSPSHASEQRPLPAGAPRSHVDLPSDERSSRLFGKSVAWQGKEPELRPSTEVRNPAEPSRRPRPADLSPAERASGKVYAVAAAPSGKIAALAPSGGSPALNPHQFGTPSGDSPPDVLVRAANDRADQAEKAESAGKSAKASPQAAILQPKPPPRSAARKPIAAAARPSPAPPPGCVRRSSSLRLCLKWWAGLRNCRRSMSAQ